GHPLMGDDAIGPLVVEELSARSWPDGVEFLVAATCTPDIFPRTLAGATGRRGEPVDLIIVDALEAGHPPGTVSVLAPGEIPIDPSQMDHPVSIHACSVGHLLAALRLAGMDPGSVTIIGIEPACIQPAEGLSPELRMAWDRVIEVCAKAVMDCLAERHSTVL
ncbi:MAG: hydrogenase maturation protease, partial [Bacillota bacterium]